MFKKIISYVLVVLIITAISGVVSFYFLAGNSDDTASNNDHKKIRWKEDGKSVFNVLLLGADEKQNGQSRSDTLMVANIDLETRNISIISIPRDTRVKFKDGNYHKINAAYSYGGVKLVKTTVAEFLGISIDYYLKINYNDFIDLVNLIDGVELEIEKDLQYVDQAANLNISLTAGQQILNGEQALDYVRFRHDYLGDIGRVRRQQKFLKSAADKLLSTSIIFKLPKLLNEVRNTIDTDLSFTNWASIAKLADDFDKSQLKTVTLPGKAGYIEGVSYWLVETEKINTILSSF